MEQIKIEGTMSIQSIQHSSMYIRKVVHPKIAARKHVQFECFFSKENKVTEEGIHEDRGGSEYRGSWGLLKNKVVG